MVIDAIYTSRRLLVTATLKDEIWQRAQAYPLLLPQDRGGGCPVEIGDVRFAWHEEYVYIGYRFTDTDVVAEAVCDQMRLWEMGDVAELFIGPVEQTYYWEMHVAPNGRKMALFLPGPGRRGLPSAALNPDLDTLQVAAQVNGTINNWRHRDEGWTAMMAVPVATLTAHGDRFGPGMHWRVLAARYNYSRFLSEVELSSCPQLSRTCFHMPGEYAELRLLH